MKSPEERRECVERTAAARAKRSDQQQLDRLRKGGHGHCKEAKRLEEAISARSDQ